MSLYLSNVFNRSTRRFAALSLKEVPFNGSKHSSKKVRLAHWFRIVTFSCSQDFIGGAAVCRAVSRVLMFQWFVISILSQVLSSCCQATGIGLNPQFEGVKLRVLHSCPLKQRIAASPKAVSVTTCLGTPDTHLHYEYGHLPKMARVELAKPLQPDAHLTQIAEQLVAWIL